MISEKRELLDAFAEEISLFISKPSFGLKEERITCNIDEARFSEAVRALHTAFELEQVK